jgi:hypothetical protein
MHIAKQGKTRETNTILTSMFLFKMHSIGSVRPIPRTTALVNHWWNNKGVAQPSPQSGHTLVSGSNPETTLQMNPENPENPENTDNQEHEEDVVVIQEEEMVLVRKETVATEVQEAATEVQETEVQEAAIEVQEEAPRPQCIETESTVMEPSSKPKPKKKNNKKNKK